MSPRARSRARGSLVQAAAWGFTTVAALVCVLGTVTAAAAGGGTGHPAALRDGPGLTVFRIDVSRYPQVGMVVTAPGTSRGLPAADFSITVGGHVVRPWVRQLSPGEPAAGAALDAPGDLYFVFLMPCRGSRRGISR